MDNVTIYEFLREKGKIPTGPGHYNNSTEIANSITVGTSADGEDIDALLDGSITEISSDVKRLRGGAFYDCTKLTKVNFPNITQVPGSCFFECTALERLDFPQVTLILPGAFRECTSLTALVLRSPTVAEVQGINYSNPFESTPIQSGTGYIYVPDELVDSYKAANGWSKYANQIKGISELPTE